MMLEVMLEMQRKEAVALFPKEDTKEGDDTQVLLIPAGA